VVCACVWLVEDEKVHNDQPTLTFMAVEGMAREAMSQLVRRNWRGHVGAWRRHADAFFMSFRSTQHSRMRHTALAACHCCVAVGYRRVSVSGFFLGGERDKKKEGPCSRSPECAARLAPIPNGCFSIPMGDMRICMSSVITMTWFCGTGTLWARGQAA